MAAARAFAAQRPAAQPLGVVTFNATPSVLSKPTTDGDSLSSALSHRPTLTRGTHIYDALAAALHEIDPGEVRRRGRGGPLGRARLRQHRDARARSPRRERRHARLFTVGLQSSLFDPSSLRSIAGLGGGEYLGAASPSALAAIYRSLGDQLANAYTIRYLSSVPIGCQREGGRDRRRRARDVRLHRADHSHARRAAGGAQGQRRRQRALPVEQGRRGDRGDRCPAAYHRRDRPALPASCTARRAAPAASATTATRRSRPTTRRCLRAGAIAELGWRGSLRPSSSRGWTSAPRSSSRRRSAGPSCWRSSRRSSSARLSWA